MLGCHGRVKHSDLPCPTKEQSKPRTHKEISRVHLGQNGIFFKNGNVRKAELQANDHVVCFVFCAVFIRGQ